ncbi:hypothetical protein JJV70_15150 [Streptomyces sp. JJ66]|uniref:hypothetical protein n=1 Tax=Streptomyces sp. JJ66 TaxID=2803843 RepID=UPI001C559B80|nr:hypothetical protein [Streptomyces sp. JJ66]MBW1603416.1 hypothetical protein [Streptomyces sp. JJ66]
MACRKTCTCDFGKIRSQTWDPETRRWYPIDDPCDRCHGETCGRCPYCRPQT